MEGKHVFAYRGRLYSLACFLKWSWRLVFLWFRISQTWIRRELSQDTLPRFYRWKLPSLISSTHKASRPHIFAGKDRLNLLPKAWCACVIVASMDGCQDCILLARTNWTYCRKFYKTSLGFWLFAAEHQKGTVARRNYSTYNWSLSGCSLRCLLLQMNIKFVYFHMWE